MFDVFITGLPCGLRVKSNAALSHWQAASSALRVAGCEVEVDNGLIMVDDGLNTETFRFVTIDGMSAVL